MDRNGLQQRIEYIIDQTNSQDPVSPVVYHHCENWRNKKVYYIYYKDLSIAILKREKYCEMRLNKYCVFYKIASLETVHYS